MIRNNAWRIALLASLCIILVIAYYLAGRYSLFRRAQVFQEVTIARTGGVPSALFWIAEDKGYFRDAGLHVQYLDFDAGQPGLDALRDGKADITESGETPIVRSILRGDKLHIVAELESDDGKNIAAWRSHGIVTPAGLKGKTIGVTKGTVNEFQLLSFLEAYGLDEHSVELIDVPFVDSATVFRSGKVDAISARQATIVELKQELGDRIIVFSTEGIYTFRFLLVARDSLIQERPEVVNKVMQALVKAESYMLENPDDARAITTQHMQLSQKVVDGVWPNYHFSINLSQPIFLTLEDESRWLIARDPTLPKDMPNFLSYIYFDALEKEKPGVVTISH